METQTVVRTTLTPGRAQGRADIEADPLRLGRGRGARAFWVTPRSAKPEQPGNAQLSFRCGLGCCCPSLRRLIAGVIKPKFMMFEFTPEASVQLDCDPVAASRFM